MSLRLQPVDLLTKGWQDTTALQNTAAAGVPMTEKVLATPLEALTTISLQGTGAVDVLMRATKLHLQEEFNAGRITGKEYSTVYLGALTAVLQTATQFLLNEQQVHKLNADIGLVRQQTVTELANTDDNIPAGLGFNHIPAEITAIPPVSCYGLPQAVLSTWFDLLKDTGIWTLTNGSWSAGEIYMNQGAFPGDPSFYGMVTSISPAGGWDTAFAPTKIRVNWEFDTVSVDDKLTDLVVLDDVGVTLLELNDPAGIGKLTEYDLGAYNGTKLGTVIFAADTSTTGWVNGMLITGLEFYFDGDWVSP